MLTALQCKKMYFLIISNNINSTIYKCMSTIRCEQNYFHIQQILFFAGYNLMGFARKLKSLLQVKECTNSKKYCVLFVLIKFKFLNKIC